MATNLDVDAVVESPEQNRHTTVTEVWPGQFELEITTGGDDISTTATHTLETAQLHQLAEQIEDALHNAH